MWPDRAYGLLSFNNFNTNKSANDDKIIQRGSPILQQSELIFLSYQIKKESKIWPAF